MKLRNWETVDVSPTGWTRRIGYHFTEAGARWSADLLNAVSPGAGHGYRVIVRKSVK